MSPKDRLGETGTELRSWWIPKRVPEYLLSTNSNKIKSGPNEDKDARLDKTPVKSVPPLPSPSALSSSPAKEPSIQRKVLTNPNPSDMILFSKYQQPEPKHPDALRFPISVPISRNKYGSGSSSNGNNRNNNVPNSLIMPRYDNNSNNKPSYPKTSLLRWMNAHWHWH